MNYPTCALINGLLAILNFFANAFYIFCMVYPLHGERIKQPLKLLLWSLIGYTTIYLITVFMLVTTVLEDERGELKLMLQLVSICSLTASMTSSVWLNFFYYTQIVPAQRAIFIWIKKNIKPIIYCIWLVERIYSLLHFTVRVLDSFPLDGFGSNYNFTLDHDIQMPAPAVSKWLAVMCVIVFVLLKAHFVVCLCVMMMSSGSTAVYLCRHMHRMVANGQPLCGSQFKSQVRVTVTGILQGVLFMFCSAWTGYELTSQRIFIMSSQSLIYFTIISLYMTGTMFNLGVGQGVFRQRAADIWLRAAQWCKAPKEQQSGEGG